MNPAKKVIVNTGFLYGKMGITIFIALFSTRLILNALGEIDFGIFNLIGGIIALLSFINGAMIIATQRYLTYSIGSDDKQRLKSVFSSSVILHLIIGFSVVILLELAGLFLFNGSLKIPPERIDTAKFIFHCMVVSTFFTINAVPYDATINAHENMLLDAVVGIIESILKLGIAILLVYAESDKLVLYGVLIASLTILVRIAKGIYCHKKYEECRINIRSYLQLDLLREMMAFAGWHLLGLLCAVLKQQGFAILLNLFFGIVINAAYGIANQVNANMSNFSRNMVRAISPQITKSEGGGDRERMIRLSVFACKVPFFLFAFFAVPLIIEMPIVLKVWLKTVPEHTIIFCQLILVVNLVDQLTVGLATAITSVGRIKAYQTVIGLVLIFNLPVAFLLIKLGLPAYSILVSSIVLELIIGGLRIWYAHNIVGISTKDFLINTIASSLLTLTLAGILAVSVRFLLPEGLLRLSLVFITSTLSIIFLSWHLTLNAVERERIKGILTSFIVDFKKLKTVFNTKNVSI